MSSDTRVSAQHPPLPHLDDWLVVERHTHNTPRYYCHLLIRQKDVVKPDIWDELFKYIDHAHEGARLALRASLGETLHPLDRGISTDPAALYPHKFEQLALQAFLGEIIAGIISENYVGGDDQAWFVPVYLFRTHTVAFQQLEMMKQAGNWQRRIVGRTGDDGLAFALDEHGRIVAWLACEAKCTGSHASSLVSDNHAKLSQQAGQPIDLLRAIDALRDYRDDDYSRKWITALRNYWYESQHNPSVRRDDFSMYICGSFPVQKTTWISIDAPHSKYIGGRDLTSAEFHLANIAEVVSTLYGKMESGN